MKKIKGLFIRYYILMIILWLTHMFAEENDIWGTWILEETKVDSIDKKRGNVFQEVFILQQGNDLMIERFMSNSMRGNFTIKLDSGARVIDTEMGGEGYAINFMKHGQYSQMVYLRFIRNALLLAVNDHLSIFIRKERNKYFEISSCWVFS